MLEMEKYIGPDKISMALIKEKFGHFSFEGEGGGGHTHIFCYVRKNKKVYACMARSSQLAGIGMIFCGYLYMRWANISSFTNIMFIENKILLT